MRAILSRPLFHLRGGLDGYGRGTADDKVLTYGNIQYGVPVKFITVYIINMIIHVTVTCT